MEGKEGSYDTKEYVHRSTSTQENRTNELWYTSRTTRKPNNTSNIPMVRYTYADCAWQVP